MSFGKGVEKGVEKGSPRTGGSRANHDRTAATDNRAWRHGGGMAARGARARAWANLSSRHRDWPSGCRTAEQRAEVAAVHHHSITSSASRRNGSGIVSPSAFARRSPWSRAARPHRGDRPRERQVRTLPRPSPGPPHPPPGRAHAREHRAWRFRTSSGLIVETEAFDESEFDTLIVLGTLLEPGLLLLVGTVNSVICADALPGKPTPSETAANMPNAHAHRCADIESLEVPINLAPKLHSRSSPSQSLRL